ncbi:hypothetical protein N7492_002720 [Penicillium capsulatum]|uniref:Uncharacterized protein n=1 Tax=Penicillium capsulatum TaxID=69766 RepID=A0A9W9IJ46_9EURO|nr:hypothetical protein N7492_002720 [Penicillium capsulatum]KAJ6122683.1 hypothetical protein N7512_005148 [Penicillium capsulatum]
MNRAQPQSDGGNPSPVVIRQILASQNETEKQRYPNVFYIGGTYRGQVKPPFWPVVVGLSDAGRRYLPDRIIDDAIPFWREYMLAGALLPEGWGSHQATWDAFLSTELHKYLRLGRPWPFPDHEAMRHPSVRMRDLSDDPEDQMYLWDDDGVLVDWTQMTIYDFMVVSDALDDREILCRQLRDSREQSRRGPQN